MITAENLTDEQVRAVRDSVMNGSPLSEDCAVALDELVLDDGDPNDNIEMARERIAAAISVRANGW